MPEFVETFVRPLSSITSSDNLKKSSSESKVKKSDFLKDLEKFQENSKILEKENVELKNKISVEKRISRDYESKIKSYEMKISILLKQISDFEQVLVLERDKFEKERTEFQTERKVFETKSVEFSLKISGLTKNLSDLSMNFMKEQKVKSDLQKKYDLFFKENNVLINKVKELEDIVFKVDVSKQASPDTVDQTPLANSTKSECSFKTASSSIFKNISLKESEIPNDFSKDQIHPSNLFYNSTFDKLDKDLNVSKVNTSSKRKDNLVFKRVKMEWRVKGTTSKKKVPNSKVPNSNVKKNNTYQGKSFVKPDVIYSVNQLVRIAQKKLCCSYCGTDDFVNKRYIQHWFGSYRISAYATAPNKPGPKFNWVPKSI